MLDVVAELLYKCVEENARSALDQQEYQQRYTSLVEAMKQPKKKDMLMENLMRGFRLQQRMRWRFIPSMR